jgi:hypothetical protein
MIFKCILETQDVVIILLIILLRCSTYFINLVLIFRCFL